MDDDDDDVPLGMLRPGMRPSSSVISLSSMRDGVRTPGSGPSMKASTSKSPARRTSAMSPGLPTTPTKLGARTLSPSETPEGRRVPGRSKTTPLISPDQIHPMFPSPASSPKLGPTVPKADQEEVGYFGLNGGGKIESPAVVPAAAVDDSPLFDFKSLDYPIDAFSTSPQAVKTVKLDHAPIALAPPIAISPSRSTAKPANLSIAVPATREAMVTSKETNGVANRQDSLDTDLVVRSMALYADESTVDENEPPTPRVAMHQQSHSTLFGDASSDNSTIRSPLSERLGNLVGPRPMSSKPSLPKLNTLKLEDGNGHERVMSPGSDTTISPTVSTIRDHQSVPSSFARSNGTHVTSSNHNGSKVDSDESDTESGSGSESDDEDVVPPKRPEGPPRSSFTNAPRPRVQPPINSPSRAKPARESSASSDGDESSDQDKPLARIKSKVSRSKLAPNQTSTAGRPRSVFDQHPQKPHQNPPSAEPPAKASTTPAPSAPSQLAGQTRRASVPTVVSPPMNGSKVNGINGLGAGPASPTKRIWSASPASSQSGLTGDSSAVQPVTPNENELADNRAFKAPPTASGQQQVSHVIDIGIGDVADKVVG